MQKNHFDGSKNNHFDPEALRTFAIVARLRSFSAAAEYVHRTTSALSYRIKSLEDSIGTPLFVRTTRTVTLTAAGEVLLEKVNMIFDWLQALPEELQQVNEGVEPRFILVVNNLLYDCSAVAGLLSHLLARFPRTAFEVRRAVYMGVWDELIYNGGHMAIGAPGFHTVNDEFSTHPLGVINWAFVVAPDHPLAAMPGPLSDDDLRPFPAINVQDTSHRLRKRIAWKLTGQRELLVPDMRTKLFCHLQGVGVGFMPTTVVKDLLRTKELVELSVVNGRSPSPLSLAWRRNGAGKVCEYFHDLCTTPYPLMTSLLATLDPA